MVKHVRGNITAPPQKLHIVDQRAFDRLPQSVQEAVNDFYGDGLSLTTAMISRVEGMSPAEQLAIQRDFFLAFGYLAEG